MTTTSNITTHARFLRNAAPQAYNDFVAAFVAYFNESKDILVDATQNVQLAQGHAQQCKKLLKALEEAKNG